MWFTRSTDYSSLCVDVAALELYIKFNTLGESGDRHRDGRPVWCHTQAVTVREEQAKQKKEGLFQFF